MEATSWYVMASESNVIPNPHVNNYCFYQPGYESAKRKIPDLWDSKDGDLIIIIIIIIK